jgi:hypothetical protein
MDSNDPFQNVEVVVYDAVFVTSLQDTNLGMTRAENRTGTHLSM